MPKQEVLRAFRFALDPTASQEEELRRYAGAARWAFNHALAAKVAAHEEWRAQVAALVESGVPEDVARSQVKVPIPTKPAIQKAWNQTKGDSRSGVDGCCPWWHEVNTYCFQSAFLDADAAWKNWLDSVGGRRAGRRVGYPRFKKKGRSRDSFRIHHDVKKPGIRLETYRRLRIPKLGEFRLHDSGKRLARLIARGEAVVQSVTVARRGHRWYASVLCKVMQDIPDRPTRRQAAAGRVGVDFGVTHLLALSRPVELGAGLTEFVDNPRHLKAAMRRLRRAQQALSRTELGSARRDKARRRVARLHAQVAERRATFLHTLTKRLTSSFETVAIEDLNVSGMTRSARGSVDAPGRRVRQKAGLNRAILDASPGEFRRQLTYKASWYGSKLAVVDRWFPSSKTCSACGEQNPRLTLADRVFICSCGFAMNRDVNAALNIAAHAVVPSVASDSGETLNARGASVRPSAFSGRRGAAKREGSSVDTLESPQRSDPLAFPP